MKKTTKLNMRIYEEDKDRLNKICEMDKHDGKKRSLIFKEILDTYCKAEGIEDYIIAKIVDQVMEEHGFKIEEPKVQKVEALEEIKTESGQYEEMDISILIEED